LVFGRFSGWFSCVFSGWFSGRLRRWYSGGFREVFGVVFAGRRPCGLGGPRFAAWLRLGSLWRSRWRWQCKKYSRLLFCRLFFHDESSSQLVKISHAWAGLTARGSRGETLLTQATVIPHAWRSCLELAHVDAHVVGRGWRREHALVTLSLPQGYPQIWNFLGSGIKAFRVCFPVC
jgi:hypothetical protein